MDAPRYGNAIRTGSFRVFGWLPVESFIILLITFTISFLFVLLHFYIFGLACFAVSFVIVVTFGLPFGDSDTTLATRIGRVFRHTRRQVRGETTFLNTHMSSRSSQALMGLPGMLHTVKTIDSVDGLGRPVQLLHHPSVGMASVTFSGSPVGAMMQPQENTTKQVGSFAHWLGSLASEGGLLGASVTVDSIRESSVPMAESILEGIDARSPQVAQQILREAVGALPARVAKVTSYVTLGWSLSELDDDIDGAVAEIVSRLPRHKSSLSASGAGQMHAMASAEYGDMMYTAYNPHRTGEVEWELHHDLDAVRPFEGSGPEALDASHKRVVLHDGVASMTVMMTTPDPSKITEKTYRRLFEPSHHFLRKRVTMFYRPIVAASQRSKIDSSDRGVMTENSSQKRVTVFEAKKAHAVKQTMEQMSQGAVIHEWALMVTVTFEPNRAAQRVAENEIKAMMGGMNWCFADYAADSAFHQTLPVGLFPWVYSSRPLLFKAQRVIETKGD